MHVVYSEYSQRLFQWKTEFAKFAEEFAYTAQQCNVIGERGVNLPGRT